jgi:hypothetical protein
MDGDELDLTVIEATHEYRPGSGTALRAPGTRAPETNGAHNGSAVEDAERASLEAQIRHLEAELENWQRRTVMWRERALSAKALNEALTDHLDDLRTVIQRLPVPAVDQEIPRTSGVPIEPGTEPHAEHSTSSAIVAWCNRVLRREFWTDAR